MGNVERRLASLMNFMLPGVAESILIRRSEYESVIQVIQFISQRFRAQVFGAAQLMSSSLFQANLCKGVGKFEFQINFKFSLLYID